MGLRFRSALAGAGLALVLSACGDDGPALEPLSPGATILAFGDSLTYGTGARDGESYPEVLAGLSGHPVVNAGVPGEVTAAGLRRLPGVLADVAPALVILCHGGNDMLQKRRHEEAAENLSRMVRLIRESGAQVVLLGVPRFGLILDTADFYHQVAEAEQVPMEADALATIISDNDLKADTVHPNARGYSRLAEAVQSLLQSHGAL
jgi:lysophospholipase L1-like esterase